MNTSALAMMIISIVTVTFMTIYYFIKVLRTPVKNPETDSFTETN
jgi:hypothetical protein